MYRVDPPKSKKTEGFLPVFWETALWKSHRKRSSIVPDMSAIFNFFYVIWFWGILAENLQNTSKYQRFAHFCPPAYWTNLSGKTAGIDTEISPKPVRGGPLATANIFYVIPSGSDLQIASSMWFNSWISSILVSRNIYIYIYIYYGHHWYHII